MVDASPGTLSNYTLCPAQSYKLLKTISTCFKNETFDMRRMNKNICISEK